jgi:hypothetical protein
VRRLALIFALAFAVSSTSACLVHVKGTRREGKSCGKNKVWTHRNGKWKCKHRHHKRGHDKKHKGPKVRDHRKK